jgi:hypothetical protein
MRHEKDIVACVEVFVRIVYHNCLQLYKRTGPPYACYFSITTTYRSLQEFAHTRVPRPNGYLW